jgi:hypothetical protein
MKINKQYRFFFLNTIISVRGVNLNFSPRSSKNRNDTSAQTPTGVPLPAQVQSIQMSQIILPPTPVYALLFGRPDDAAR